MKILIFGIASAIGRALTAELLERGHDVCGQEHPKADGGPEGVRVWRGDLRRSIAHEAIREERPDAVVHLGTVSPFGGGSRAEAIKRLNLQGTRAVLDAVRRCGVGQLLFVGSHAYYGAAPDLSVCHREDDPPHAVETFPELADLVAADLMTASAMCGLSGTRTSILRVCHCIGASGRGMLSQLLRGHRVPTVLGFDPVVQFLDERDVALALSVALEHRLMGIYNVGGTRPLPLSTIAQKLGRVVTPFPEGLFRLSVGRFGMANLPSGALSHFKYSIVIDDGLFRSRTGFVPKFDEDAALSAFREVFPA
ncbi:MAG: NAD-dependent epimerase/dehydratase family protein [Polyangiaceae bacterium]